MLNAREVIVCFSLEIDKSELCHNHGTGAVPGLCAGFESRSCAAEVVAVNAERKCQPGTPSGHAAACDACGLHRYSVSLEANVSGSTID